VLDLYVDLTNKSNLTDRLLKRFNAIFGSGLVLTIEKS